MNRTAEPAALRRVETEAVELDLLLEAVYRVRGYDFREYARASLRRRVENQMRQEEVSTISALLDLVLHDEEAMDRFILGLAVNVSAMFRDPPFFLAFRRDVVPVLRTYPFIRIWIAGCSTGEEVYSVVILLEEEGLIDRCRIYATDISERVLQTAREGIYPVDLMQKYTQNYIGSGGKRAFSEYYTAAYEHAIIRPSLRDRVLFARHNLVTDGGFNEFNLILCRNVMIYFNRRLQDRVHELLYASLATFGILALGSRESLTLSQIQDRYEAIDEDQRIYRRIS